jgi:hypothetical protein
MQNLGEETCWKTTTWKTKKEMKGYQVDGTGSGPCPVASIGISGVEPWVLLPDLVFNLLLLYYIYLICIAYVIRW